MLDGPPWLRPGSTTNTACTRLSIARWRPSEDYMLPRLLSVSARWSHHARPPCLLSQSHTMLARRVRSLEICPLARAAASAHRSRWSCARRPPTLCMLAALSMHLPAFARCSPLARTPLALHSRVLVCCSALACTTLAHLCAFCI